MSVHQRPTLYTPKLKQRVRMDGTVAAAPAKEWPWNAHGPLGQYAESFVAAGCVWFRWCPVGTPPFAHTVCVAALADATSPRMILDARGGTRLSYASGGQVFLTESYDDGLTWTEGTVAFASGTWPTISLSGDGMMILAARVAGELQIRRRAAGATALETAFVAVDDASANIALADDSFHLSPAPDGPRHWLLHCRIDAETDTSTWHSEDDCESFERF